MVPRNGKIALGRCCPPRGEDADRIGLLGQWVDAWHTVRLRCRPRSENSEQRAEIGCDM